MTQPQAQQQYVVIPGREVSHAGVKYPADTVVDLPEDVALVHIEGGTLRSYVDKIDGKKAKAE
jgi:hypothetical protein